MGLCEGGVNPVGPGGEPDRVNRGGRALRAARGKQQAMLSQPGLRGRARREATCRSGKLLAVPELFVSGHWRRRGAASSRLAGSWRTARAGRGEGGGTARPGGAGPSRVREPPARAPEPEPPPRRHALVPRAAEECVPGRGAQVHRALQQVLPVPAVHEAVSGLRCGVGRGRLAAGPRGCQGGASVRVLAKKDERGGERP